MSLKGARLAGRDNNKKTSDCASFSCPCATMPLRCLVRRKTAGAAGSALLAKRSSVSKTCTSTRSPLALDPPLGRNTAVAVKSARRHLICTESESHPWNASDGMKAAWPGFPQARGRCRPQPLRSCYIETRRRGAKQKPHVHCRPNNSTVGHCWLRPQGNVRFLFRPRPRRPHRPAAQPAVCWHRTHKQTPHAFCLH